MKGKSDSGTAGKLGASGSRVHCGTALAEHIRIAKIKLDGIPDHVKYASPGFAQGKMREVLAELDAACRELKMDEHPDEDFQKLAAENGQLAAENMALAQALMNSAERMQDTLLADGMREALRLAWQIDPKNARASYLTLLLENMRLAERVRELEAQLTAKAT